jgi:hypothetical protein
VAASYHNGISSARLNLNKLAISILVFGKMSSGGGSWAWLVLRDAGVAFDKSA